MKIVSVLGSPRKSGNSASIAKRFCDTAEGLGADVQTFFLNDLKYQGCQACMGCKIEKEVCVLNDDLTEVLNAAKEADILVAASPVYMGEMTSQFKGFLDRTFSYTVPDFHSQPKTHRLDDGKKVVLVQTQGQPDSMFGEISQKFQFIFQLIGFEQSHVIRGCQMNMPDDALKSEETMKRAEDAANQLVG